MRDVACTRVATRILVRVTRMSHAFGIEFVAGLYRMCVYVCLPPRPFITSGVINLNNVLLLFSLFI